MHAGLSNSSCLLLVRITVVVQRGMRLSPAPSHFLLSLLLHPRVYCCCCRWLAQSLLSLRKQQSIACLAFSCDWLSHKLLKICVAIKHQYSDTHASGVKLNSPSRPRDFEGRTSSSAGSATAPTQKLRQIGRKLSQLADDSLLCLRLEVRQV